MGLKSGIASSIARHKIQRAKEELKKRGINPHVGPEDVRVEGLLGANVDESGNVRIGVTWAWSEAVAKHELFHRAHLLRHFAPRKRDRKRLRNGKRVQIPEEFVAISELGALLAEGRGTNVKRLADINARMLSRYGIVATAYGKYVGDMATRLMEDLKKAGVRKDALGHIVKILYESGTLHDLRKIADIIKDYGEAQRLGIKLSPRQILAIKRLGAWRK